MSEQMYGQAQSAMQGGGVATKRDTVHGISSDLDHNIERLAKLYEAMRLIGDRIDGSRPEPIGSVGQPESPPASMILDMRRKQTAMSGFIGKCEDELQRLAQALGITGG